MAYAVCNPVMKAVRAMLHADFYNFDNADDLIEQVVEYLMDNTACTEQQVTEACPACRLQVEPDRHRHQRG